MRVMPSNSKLMNDISILLLDEPLSLKEISNELSLKEKKTFSLLRKMFKEERINSYRSENGQRKYNNTQKNLEKAIKLKERRTKKVKK
jgi:hypothetical protein